MLAQKSKLEQMGATSHCNDPSAAGKPAPECIVPEGSAAVRKLTAVLDKT